jgi:mono/diheme cytochrome c family protein
MPVGDPVTGKKLFAGACKICHSKDMVQNEFVTSSTDQELVEFITIGGFPDQPLVMLPKGGKPSLTGEELYDIVAFLRTLQK